MNEIVANFIEEQKKKNEAERLIQRTQHLLDLGLVDDSTKQYCSKDLPEWQRNESGYTRHDEKGYFKYVGDPVAIDVSDEEYEEICKICPPKDLISENEFQAKLLKKTESIRQMLLFFVILAVIGLVWGLISLIITNW